MVNKYDYNWTLKDAKFTKDKGTVFSCFACGGGSTMGYKLAGFDVIGCNEIDPKMNNIYIANHNPKFNFLMDIRDLVKKSKSRDLPKELYQLDILDGSPPCSTFSMAGDREKAWGKEKKFREGQKNQILDTLFFDFIQLAKELQPKVVIAENVKGLILGNAKDYVRRIYEEFDKSGYYCQHFLLNASKMGVPQQRERVFFICLRKDLAGNLLKICNLFESKPYIDMSFNENPILFKYVTDGNGKKLSCNTKLYRCWENAKKEETSLKDAYKRLFGKVGYFSAMLFSPNKVAYTIVPDYHGNLIHKDIPKYLSNSEIIKCSTFPSDYNFCGSNVGYVCGMSVPPVMMAQVASRVYEYWLSKINIMC